MSTKNWELNSDEVGKSCGKNEGSTFKVWIAKILPLISFKEPDEKRVLLSKSCFCNSKPPSTSSSVLTKNYIDIPLSEICTLKSAKHGDKLNINVKQHRVDSMNVVGLKDRNIN